MQKKTSKVPVFRAFAGIAASTAIVCLLFEEGVDTVEPRIITYALVAALSLITALIPAQAAPGFIAHPRPSKDGRLRLERFGLTRREREFVLEFLAGASMKEMSIEHHLSYSTVRNAFSSVYEKLGLSGSAELFALGAYYEIE